MDVRVAVLEDDFYAREAVATWLQRDRGIRVVGEYGEPGGLLAHLSNGRTQPHVCWVSLDLSGPPGCVSELVQRLHVTAPGARVLGSTLTLQPEHEQLWALGLAGLVLKHECGNAVGVAVRAVAQGWRVVTPGARALAGNEANPPVWVLKSAALPDDLPPHLRRVAYLRYVRQLTPDQIAEELVLSPNTVESYLKIVKSALHLDGRTQLLTRGFVAVTRGAEESAPPCPLTV